MLSHGGICIENLHAGLRLTAGDSEEASQHGEKKKNYSKETILQIYCKEEKSLSKFVQAQGGME